MRTVLFAVAGAWAVAGAMALRAPSTAAQARSGLGRQELAEVRREQRRRLCAPMDGEDPQRIRCSVSAQVPRGERGEAREALILRVSRAFEGQHDSAVLVIDSARGLRTFLLGDAQAAGGGQTALLVTRTRYERGSGGSTPRLVVNVRIFENDDDMGVCSRSGRRIRRTVVCTLGDEPQCIALPEFRDDYDEQLGGCDAPVRRAHRGASFSIQLEGDDVTITRGVVARGPNLELTLEEPADFVGRWSLQQLFARPDLALPETTSEELGGAPGESAPGQSSQSSTAR